MNCNSCGAEVFYDREKVQQGVQHVCWRCQSVVNLPIRISLNGRIKILNWNSRLYPHHLDPKSSFDFSRPIAEVTQHPTDPNIWGLKNLSAEKWVMTHTDGTNFEVPPGKNVPLVDGTSVHFGDLVGVIKR